MAEQNADNIHHIDMLVCATAYIRADSEADAIKIAEGLRMSALELDEQDGEVPISGAPLDSEDLPDVSLSPAMTIHGVWKDAPTPKPITPSRAKALEDALKKILEGSEVGGRWLDVGGNECDPHAEGATFEAYTGEEQDQWLLSVAEIARTALAVVDEPARKPYLAVIVNGGLVQSLCFDGDPRDCPVDPIVLDYDNGEESDDDAEDVIQIDNSRVQIDGLDISRLDPDISKSIAVHFDEDIAS